MSENNRDEIMAGEATSLKADKYDAHDDEHECDEALSVDIDICSGCGEHSGFCSVCCLSSCCGAAEPYID